MAGAAADEIRTSDQMPTMDFFAFASAARSSLSVTSAVRRPSPSLNIHLTICTSPTKQSAAGGLDSARGSQSSISEFALLKNEMKTLRPHGHRSPFAELQTSCAAGNAIP